VVQQYFYVTVGEDAVPDGIGYFIEESYVLCRQADTSLLLSERAVQVSDERAHFRVHQEIETFVNNQEFGYSFAFLDFLGNQEQGHYGYYRKIFRFGCGFHIIADESVIYDVDVFPGVKEMAECSGGIVIQ